jgi:hypothetical protein
LFSQSRQERQDKNITDALKRRALPDSLAEYKKTPASLKRKAGVFNCAIYITCYYEFRSFPDVAKVDFCRLVEA